MYLDADPTKILIVDDDAPVSDTLALIFVKSGYAVRVAYSAEQAIETIASWSPDIALLDVMLPGKSGIDLALVLKDNHPHCKPLLFSGCDKATGLLEKAGQQGHTFDILAKPAHPLEVLQRTKDLLAVNSEGAGENTSPRGAN